MIEQLRENLGWVDAFVEYDTTGDARTWVPAAERTSMLYRKALDLAERAGERCWYLQTAPDERFSEAAEEAVRVAIDDHPLMRFTFRLRELWTPTEYRVDGVWGGKRRRRLYQLNPGGPIGSYTTDLDVNLYHLKMIEEENRRRRREVFTDHNTWDNKTRGFDYLTDERGLALEAIPPGQSYFPEYRTYEFQVPGYE